MDTTTLLTLAALMALAAALYSSVGHGGASGYLALMALFTVAPATMRPTALALNLLVAGAGAISYMRAGQFNARLFWPFAITAIPLAFVGGTIHLPPEVYRPLVGVTLLVAAARLALKANAIVSSPVAPPPLYVSLPLGAVTGLLAGLTGTGGGIFLSPLILLLAWEEPRRTSGVSAAFVFVNSLAGLAGNYASLRQLPPELPVFVAAVAIGASVGIWAGIKSLPREWLLKVLAVVLVMAGFKLLFT